MLYSFRTSQITIITKAQARTTGKVNNSKCTFFAVFIWWNRTVLHKRNLFIRRRLSDATTSSENDKCNLYQLHDRSAS